MGCCPFLDFPSVLGFSPFFRGLSGFVVFLLLLLLVFLVFLFGEKTQGKPPKNTGLFIPTEPLKSLQDKGKTQKKNNPRKKKIRNSQKSKQGKETQDCLSPPNPKIPAKQGKTQKKSQKKKNKEFKKKTRTGLGLKEDLVVHNQEVCREEREPPRLPSLDDPLRWAKLRDSSRRNASESYRRALNH